MAKEDTTGKEIPIHKILVIDEDRIAGKWIKQGLDNQGYDVNSVENKEEALKCLELKPELVLLDLAMGEYKEGVEILKEIRKHDRHLPVFVLEREKNDASLEASVRSLEIAGAEWIQAVVHKSRDSIAQAISNFSLNQFVIENVFNDKIKPKIGEDAVFVQADISPAEPDVSLKNRKRRNSIIEKIQIVYSREGKENTINLLTKQNDSLPMEKSSATYEKRIYELIGETPFDSLVTLYDQLTHNNKLVLECWADDFSHFDHNTLDDKLREWDRQISEAKDDKDARITIEKQRRDELRRIVKKVAEMHFWATFGLYSRVGFDAEKMENHDFHFGAGKDEWAVDIKTRADYKESFRKYVMAIAGTIGPVNNLRSFSQKLSRILNYTQEGKKDIFDWTETQPIVLSHGDLHPRQIIYKTVDGQEQFKFVDLKNAKLGPGILDFAFLQSPAYNCDKAFRQELFNLYITELERIFVSAKRNVKMPGISDIKSLANPFDLYAADRIRQICWDIRIVDKINQYVKTYPLYQSAFEAHLKYAGENLEKFIDDPDCNEQYPQARMLHDLLKGVIF